VRQAAITIERMQSVRHGVNRHFDAIRSRRLRGLEEFFMACLQIKQDGFGMFAEGQAIGSEIHAVTGALLPAQAANLHRIGQTAGRLDAEIGKNGMARVRVVDDKGFFACALAAFVDFVGIRRAPIVGWRQFDFRVCFGYRAHERIE
jgi:hypothetical protein